MAPHLESAAQLTALWKQSMFVMSIYGLETIIIVIII